VWYNGIPLASPSEFHYTTLRVHVHVPGTVWYYNVSITSLFFPLSLQDPFQVWEESSTSRSLFSRAHERHIFLFEKMVIFSKKIEAPVQKREKKSDNYLYKGHLPVG
jgi:hypothetical protein